MVWESVSKGASDVVKFNHWPQPFNFLKNARVLVCNEDTFIVELQFAFNLFAYFFFTQLIPSPREIERKTFTGGYRCGFYLDIKVKSPIEIIWGQGTARMIAEISRPFTTGLFYWWGMGAIFEAFGIWQTLMFRQLLCDPFIGDVLRRDDIMSWPPGDNEGVPGLGELVWDPYHLCGPSQPFIEFPPGGWHVYAVWMFNAGPTGLTNVKTGWFDGDNVVGLTSHGDVLPGQQLPVIREAQGWSAGGFSLGAYASGTSGPSVIASAAICMRFIADWIPDLPERPDDYWFEPVAEDPRSNPKCAMEFF